jgi:hypothetical protein
LITIQIRSTEKLQWARRAAPLRERRPLEHHRAGIAARHPQVRGVRAGIDPGALAERPAEARRRSRQPALHRHDLELDVELQRPHEPAAELAERQTVAHRQRARADEALPARSQAQPFDLAAGRVRAVEHPDALAVPRGLLEHIAERGNEGVHAAADVLQIDQQHVERFHHPLARAAHLPVQAVDRDAVCGVGEVGRLDHVVLLVAAQAVLRPERGAQPDFR